MEKTKILVPHLYSYHLHVDNTCRKDRFQIGVMGSYQVRARDFNLSVSRTDDRVSNLH